MTRSNALLILTLASLAVATAPAQPADRAAAARQTMERATVFMRSLAVEGGYVYKWTPDLKKRSAERPATPTQIAIQPPGTPSVGSAFVRAYEATGTPLYLEAARDVSRALVRCQLGSGGWNRIADFDPAKPNRDGLLHQKGDLKRGQVIQYTLATTFDDNTTQSAVLFLLAYTTATKGSSAPDDVAARAALDRALAGMLRAQYPTGAWPQRYGGEPRDPANFPVRAARIPADYPRQWPDEDYTRYYTLNDNCQSTCVQTMLRAYHVTGRKELLESARRGADFLLLAQLPEPQPAWAQQYSFAMEPVWARVMEPPAVSSAESSKVIVALLDLHLETGERKYLDAVAPAAAWLERSRVGPDLWSRFYELGTNRPIYGDDRGVVRYDKRELNGKFVYSYGWESSFDIPAVLARYERIKRDGHEAVPARERKTAGRGRENEVDAVIAALDADGRWIAPDWWQKGMKPEPLIQSKLFIRNLNVLADYLEQVSPRAPR